MLNFYVLKSSWYSICFSYWHSLTFLEHARLFLEVIPANTCQNYISIYSWNWHGINNLLLQIYIVSHHNIQTPLHNCFFSLFFWCGLPPKKCNSARFCFQQIIFLILYICLLADKERDFVETSETVPFKRW